jgi:hypothetical protein
MVRPILPSQSVGQVQSVQQRLRAPSNLRLSHPIVTLFHQAQSKPLSTVGQLQRKGAGIVLLEIRIFDRREVQ